MIYWLLNYLNNNGYHFNNPSELYAKLCNSQQPQQYFVQQPSKSRRNRRFKKKLAANSDKKAAEVAKNLMIKDQGIKSQEPCLRPSQQRKNRRSKTKLVSNKKALEVAKNLILKGQEVKSQVAKGKELIVAKPCEKTKSQAKPAKEVQKFTINKKVPNQNSKSKNVAPNLTKSLNQDKQQQQQQLKVIALNKSQVATATPDIQHNHSIKANKTKFCVNDPNTPEFIQALAEAFHAEIGVMQTRLKAEASCRPVRDENDLMVAKIHIENNPKMSDNLFEFIRTEVVGWIGVYQQQGMHTPIFHNIAKKDCYLTIVCDNRYAYECLERCVNDLAQMETIDSLKILPLPPITPIIYCFDAKYDGIATDADLFLSQLHLHKPKLYTNDWLVASHKVCSEERRTYFIFLIDERSALALNYHYNQKFYVCMQQATFRYRGIVTKSI